MKFDRDKYIVFGSKDSLDKDVMYFVDFLPRNLELIKEVVSSLKPLDANFCVVKNGIVTDCFKGTIDEVNNMLFYTTYLHPQNMNLPVTREVPFDIETKMIRVARGLLSMISRSKYRKEIKTAFKSKSLRQYLDTLKMINDEEKIETLSEEKLSELDYKKFIVFQIGQVLNYIYRGKDIYTKKDVKYMFDIVFGFDVSCYLYRTEFVENEYSIEIDWIVDRFIREVEDWLNVDEVNIK